MISLVLVKIHIIGTMRLLINIDEIYFALKFRLCRLLVRELSGKAPYE
jgi:hypothetical protein